MIFRNYFCSIGSREIVEFDVVEGEEGTKVVNVVSFGGFLVLGSNCVVEWNYYRRYGCFLCVY